MVKLSSPFKRTKYIVAKNFQLRFSLLLAGIGVIATTIVGGVLYGVLVKTQTLLVGTGVVTSPGVIDYLRDQRSLYVYSLVGIFSGVTLLLLTFGIFISHRLAGPIFALSRKMSDLSHGNFNATLQLRKGDEFHDLKDRYNNLVHALQNQVKSELIKVNAAVENLEKLVVEKKMTPDGERDLRSVIRDLQAYYNYKKNLLEPTTAETYKPTEATDDELLV